MPSLERIKATVNEIAGRSKAVRFDEIENLVDQLAAVGFPTKKRATRHGYLFKVGDQFFGVCPHNRGQSHLKEIYVAKFLDAMEALGLFE